MLNSGVNLFNTARQAGIEKAAEFGRLAKTTGDLATYSEDAAIKAAKAAAKDTAKTFGSKAASAINLAANAYGTVHGGINMINSFNNDDTLTSTDIANMASRETNYANGVAYDRIGSYDVDGINNYVNAQNKANKISGATSGFETGAGIGGAIGTIVGPVGSLIGSGVGGVVGLFGGLFGSHKANERRKRAIEQAKQNYAIGVDAYNTQNESIAKSTGLRNQYYSTHGADQGLSVNHTNPNALIQGGEPVVKVDKYGNVISADMFPITPETPERVDNIPVKLDQGDTKDGVIGNKINPFTGQRLAVEARPLVEAMNDPMIQDKKPYKRALKNMLKLQDMIPSTNYNKLPMYDLGNGYGYSLIPMSLNYLNSLNMYNEAKKQPVTAIESYAPNTYLQQAGALMPTRLDVSTQLNAINDQARQAKWNISQQPYSPGQKMALLSNLFNNKIKGVSDIYTQKNAKEADMRAEYAKWLSATGEADAERRMKSNQDYIRDLRSAYAQKRLAKDTARKGMMSAINKGFENMFNNYMFRKNTGLYEQGITNKQAALITQLINANKQNGSE